jgi:hypothetical protein
MSDESVVNVAATVLVEPPGSEWIRFSKLNKFYYTALLSSFSLTTSLIFHPLTVLTVRQQAGAAITGDVYSQSSLPMNLSHTYRTLGVRGLFRGWLPIASMGMPSNVIYFNIIEITREKFQKSLRKTFPTWSSPVVDGVQAVGSSIIANFISLVPYVPAEVISSRLIVQKRDGLGMTGISRAIYAEQGSRGFFRGFTASFYVNFVSGAQWWFMYSTCKRLGSENEVGKQHPVFVDAVSGLCAGMSSVLVSHPLDTIKTRIMTNQQCSSKQAFWSVMKAVIQKEGFRALFRGLPPSLYQAALGSTLFATSYELIKTASSS